MRYTDTNTSESIGRSIILAELVISVHSENMTAAAAVTQESMNLRWAWSAR